MNNNHSGLFNRNVFRKSPEYDFISYFRYGFSARNIPPDSNNRFSTEFWIVSIRRFSRSPNSSHFLKSCPDVLEPKQTPLPCEVSASSLYPLWAWLLPALLNGAAGIPWENKTDQSASCPWNLPTSAFRLPTADLPPGRLPALLLYPFTFELFPLFYFLIPAFLIFRSLDLR